MIPSFEHDDTLGDEADFDTVFTGEDAELPSEQMQRLIQAQHSFEENMAALSQRLVETQMRLEQAVTFLSQQVTDVYQSIRDLSDGHEAHSQSQAALLAEMAKPKRTRVIRENNRVVGAEQY